MHHVSFSPPDITEDDIIFVTEVLRSGWITSGPIGEEFAESLRQKLAADYVQLVSSCTAGMELLMEILGVDHRTEVTAPAYTFTATVAPAIRRGAKVRFVDVSPNEFSPTVDDFLDNIDADTKIIIGVDFGGVVWPYDELRTRLEIKYGSDPSWNQPVIIADAAHSLGATLRGRSSASLADVAVYSFHAVKNLTTAEGGCIAWNENFDREYNGHSRLKKLALHGQDRDARTKMAVGNWKYDISEVSTKANLPDILSALGLAQLGRYDEMIERRRQHCTSYVKLADDIGIHFIEHERADSKSSYHLAVFLIPETISIDRDLLIKNLGDRGIAANVHYQPLPMLSAYRNLGYTMERLPNAHAVYNRTFSLPLSSALTIDQVEYVCDQVRSIFEEAENE